MKNLKNVKLLKKQDLKKIIGGFDTGIFVTLEVKCNKLCSTTIPCNKGCTCAGNRCAADDLFEA